LWHGSFLVIERVLRTGGHENTKHENRKYENTKTSSLESQESFSWFRGFVASSRHVYTLAVVMVGWVFFRADTLPGALAFLKAMVGLSPALPAPLTVRWFLSNDVLLAIAAGVVGSMPWLPALARRSTGGEPAGTESPRPTLSLAGAVALTAVFVLSIMHVAARSYNPFIYFRF
jgi:alginate O-acetyltransferase complex protein AlgI